MSVNFFIGLRKNSTFAFEIYKLSSVMNTGKVINVDTNILGGTPVFCGTRVPVKNLFDYLETGETVNDFLQDFDSVQSYQAIRVLEMSKKLIETSSSILV
jgi:uncharacterized protein (DUF433 family)